jgi:hypothetical protein
MPSNPRKADLPTSYSIPGMRVGNIQFERVEDEQEKVQRLHKERLGFYVKEIGTWLLGFFFVIAIGLFCFWVLLRMDTPPVERDWARSALSALLGGIVGFLFGKVAK